MTVAFILYFIVGFVSGLILTASVVHEDKALTVHHLGLLAIGTLAGYLTALLMIFIVMEVHGSKTLWRKK